MVVRAVVMRAVLPRTPTIKLTSSPISIRYTVAGTALALRYELKVATRLGEVIDIAACWADTVVGIVTSTSYVKNDRRVAVHRLSSTCHQSSAWHN